MEAEEAGEKAEIESRDSAEKRKGGGGDKGPNPNYGAGV